MDQVLNVEKINKLLREREEILRNLSDIKELFDTRIIEIAKMQQQGQCTKEQYFTYKKSLEMTREDLYNKTYAILQNNAQLIREESMISPLQLAKFIEIALYNFNGYIDNFVGFKRESKYKKGDTSAAKAQFKGFYKLLGRDDDSIAMAFVLKDAALDEYINANDENHLLFHITKGTLEEHEKDISRKLIRDEKVCLFEADEDRKLGKDKSTGKVIPFRLSFDGHADAFHSNEFNDAVARGVFEYLGIEPVQTTKLFKTHDSSIQSI